MTELEQQKFAEALERADKAMEKIHDKQKKDFEYMKGTTFNDDSTPLHYQYNITPQEYADANRLPFDEGNVVKYITRHKLKNGADDIIKAIHYCMFMLRRDYCVSSHAEFIDTNRIVKQLNVHWDGDK